MKLLTARRTGGDFRYVVHLDETRTIEQDGATVPDPAFVLDRTWGAGSRRPGETVSAYTARLTAFEAQARAEMRALCLQAVAMSAPDAGTPLAGEGADL